VKKEPVEEDLMMKHSELPSGLENIIVLSESEESGVPASISAPEAPMDKDKEVQSTELPSTIDSSVPEAP
ncbi:hypothetical protein KI387_017793, partial [Taxus chinensis]